MADHSDHHWLVFNDDRWITGCHCGFKADIDSDCGWGDSVVEHLLAVNDPDVGRVVPELAALAEKIALADGWEPATVRVVEDTESGYVSDGGLVWRDEPSD